MTILKFYADWCSPCKKLTAMLSEIEADVVSVNVEDDPMLAAKHKVQSLPTLVRLNAEGVEEARMVGMPANAHSLKEFVV